MDNEAQEKMLQIKSLLGKWTHPDGRYTILDCTKEHPLPSGREYKGTEYKGAYKKLESYKLSEFGIKTQIKSLNYKGFELTEPYYPELKEYFRNGQPITAGDILSDAMETMTVEESLPLNGIDALIASYM